MRNPRKKTVAIITDTWLQNTSGVVTALKHTKKGLEKRDFKVAMIHPGLFFSVPLPFYKEMKMALFPWKKFEEMILKIKPDYIHISTEGSLGATARKVCAKKGWRFTSAYHTRMPEYVGIRIPPLENQTRKYLKWLHRGSEKIMVSTDSLKAELDKLGFKNTVCFPLGVDLESFKWNPKAEIPAGLTKPIFTFLGRVAPEKNIKAFLKCRLPGSKLVIGSGPDIKKLKREFIKNPSKKSSTKNQQIVFAGHKKDQELTDLLSISDVLVFPSRTDTFGLVIIEALACGVPVAAYDVHGPADIVENGVTGYLGPKLAENAIKCLNLSHKRCLKEAQKFSWDNYVKNFIKNLGPTSNV